MFSGGSFGATVGKQQIDNKNRTLSSSAVSSTVGSTEGTTLKGAVVSGKQVVMDVGTSGSGNLNIESLQDTSDGIERSGSGGQQVCFWKLSIH